MPTKGHLVILSTVFLTVISPLAAEPIAFECKFVSSEGNTKEREKAIDRIVVDLEADKIELMVSRTMGTSSEINWKFENRTQTDDQFHIRRAGFQNEIIGTGTYIGDPTILYMRQNIFSWISITYGEMTWTKYACKR